MKRRHRIPSQAHFTSDLIAPAYQAEVDRTMAKTATREAAALRAFEAAEARLRKAERIKARGQREHAVLVARELVEHRRQELLAVQRQMNTVPASASHRGRGHGKKSIPGMSIL